MLTSGSFWLAVCITVGIVIANAQVSAQEPWLIIDADEITGQASDELVAKQARLTYGTSRLNAQTIYFNQVTGAARAEDSVLFTEGEKYRMASSLLEYFPKLGTAVASGEVRLTSADGDSLWANLLRYELERKTVTGEGGVRFNDGSMLEVQAADFSYMLDERTGSASEVVISNRQTAATVSAAAVLIAPDGYSMEHGSYTTCNIDDPAWQIQADSIKLSKDGKLVATDAKLRVLGVPVFYLPSLSYDLSDERRSGFLAPKFELLGSGGYSFELPYYLNLASNYDAIAKAHWYSERGVLAKLEGRWLFADSSGYGTVAAIDDRKDHVSRSFVDGVHQGRLGQFASYELALAEVSDAEIPEDFLRGDATAQKHFAKLARFDYRKANWAFGGRVESFQTIQQSNADITRPYDVLPGLYFSSQLKHLQLNLQYENFRRVADDENNGFRLASTAKSVYRANIGGMRSEFALGAAGTAYEVDDANWLTPYATMQLRQPFSGQVDFLGKNFMLVTEPQFFVAAVSRRDFAGTPNYDTTRIKQSIQELFSVNPFVGADRFEDGSSVAIGISNQLWEAGAEQAWLDLQIGQRFRFAPSAAQATVETPPESGWSNALIEGRLNPDPYNTALLRLEWNPHLDDFEQASLEMQHRSRDGAVYTVGFSRSIENETQRDRGLFSFGIQRRLWRNVSFVGDYHYNLQTRLLNELNAGMRVTAECRCWEIDLFYEYQLVSGADRNSLRFQINLLGLGGFGSDRFEKLTDKISKEL